MHTHIVLPAITSLAFLVAIPAFAQGPAGLASWLACEKPAPAAVLAK
jgi:hypothetical protein